jgi:hypothetical protein
VQPAATFEHVEALVLEAVRRLRLAIEATGALISVTPRSLEPGDSRERALRRRLPLSGELALAALPTATVLAVLALVERLTTQRLLFASLASSAFLIYLDPEHGMNRVRALTLSQGITAALVLLQRAAAWTLSRLGPRAEGGVERAARGDR